MAKANEIFRRNLDENLSKRKAKNPSAKCDLSNLDANFSENRSVNLNEKLLYKFARYFPSNKIFFKKLLKPY